MDKMIGPMSYRDWFDSLPASIKCLGEADRLTKLGWDAAKESEMLAGHPDVARYRREKAKELNRF